MPSAASTMAAGSVEPMTVIVRVRDATDHALDGEFTQPIDRIDDVEVTLIAGAIEVDRDMADQDIVVVPVAGHRAILARPKRKRLIATMDQRRAADDRHPTP